MKAGGLFTALGVLIVLGGLVWWSNKHPSVPTTTTPPAPKLISVDQKQIDGIRIVKPGSDPIELAKLADTWQIAKPMPLPADQDAVGMLTGSLATLNADRLIDDHPANLNDFGLASPALEVDVSRGLEDPETPDRQRYPGRHRHLRQTRKRSEGLYDTLVPQDQLDQNRSRPAR